MAFGYPPYPGIYQPGLYSQMAQQNPMMMQAPQIGQNPQQYPVQNQPVQQMQGGINWVQSKVEADNWPVAPGSAVALWDSNNPVIYLRKADSTGKPSTTVYDLVERVEDRPQQRPAPAIDLSNYMTVSDAEEMIDRRINDILSERLKRPSKPTKQKEDIDNE